MTGLGQKRRSGRPPVTSGLPQSTDVIRPARLVRLVPTGEVASPHSINSLALASKVWGTVRPRAFAVLRLMISS